MISPRLQTLAEDKILATLEKAQRVFNQSFEIPDVSFKDMGRVAGKAIYPNKIILGITLFEQNLERFLARTVPHEVAHLVTHKLFPKAKQAHGPEWRMVMAKLGVVDNSRCHSYDISAVSNKRQSRVKDCRVYCGCPEKFVTITLLRRMRKGTKYTCRACNQTIAI